MDNKIVRGLIKANGVRIKSGPASYKVVNTETQEFYLGSTKNISKRVNKHQQALLNGIHSNKKLQKAFDAAPNKDVFIVEIIPASTNEEALESEQKSLNSSYLDEKCLNIKAVSHMPGGSGKNTVSDNIVNSDKNRSFFESRRKLTEQEEEVRRSKLSKTSSENWKDPIFRNNHIAKNGDPVTVDGVNYNSVREACRAHGGLAPQTLRAKMKLGVDIKSSDLRRDNFKKVSANGVIYNSLNEAATALGVAANTLTWRCQNTDPKWSGFFYVT
jgi:group I intron endonuclease